MLREGFNPPEYRLAAEHDIVTAAGLGKAGKKPPGVRAVYLIAAAKGPDIAFPKAGK